MVAITVPCFTTGEEINLRQSMALRGVKHQVIYGKIGGDRSEWSTEYDAVLIRLYCDVGLTVPQIAERSDYCVMTIRRRLKKLGVYESKYNYWKTAWDKHILSGMKYADIAGLVGVSLDTVKYRAKQIGFKKYKK